MENMTKAGAIGSVRSRIIHVLVITAIAFFMSRIPLLGDAFPAAVALVTYMVSKNSIYIYLVIPAAAGILPYTAAGYDCWDSLIAVAVCGVLFAAARRIKLRMWQRALIAAAVSIISTSVYRIASATVYQVKIEDMLFEGFLIFALTVLYSSFDKAINKEEEGKLQFTALTVFCLLLAGGAGLDFFIWPVIVFYCLCAMVYSDAGNAMLACVTCGVMAALMGQTQWGFMITLLIGIGLSSFFKELGIVIQLCVFVAACAAMKTVESGIVLGTDNYSLLLATVIFLALNWKFGSKLRHLIEIFAGGNTCAREDMDMRTAELLTARAREMKELSELYSTYLDSRLVLANQFSIMQQIMDDTRRHIMETSRRALNIEHEKFTVDVAASQCAASGSINGDCCGWHDIGGGRTAMVISDGMGKGKKAATESLMVTKTIISLLRSGVDTDLTLKMINSIMLIKDDEDSFATVDLVVADRRTGKTKFYKIGAAPTLIRRKDNVEEVQLSAVPLGIVNGLKIRYVEASLKKDDWIIMMSDGISDGGDGRGFLEHIKETALRVRSGSPQTMCDLIINQASDSYIGRERDDLTVMVAKIR